MPTDKRRLTASGHTEDAWPPRPVASTEQPRPAFERSSASFARPSSRLAESLPADAYFDLFVFAPIAYACLDANGIIEEINQASCALLGDTSLYLVNRPFIVLVDKGDRTAFLEHMRRCRTLTGVVETLLNLTTRDGRSLAIRLTSKRSTSAGRTIFWTALVDL